MSRLWTPTDGDIKKSSQRKKLWKRHWSECVWKMSSSLVHLRVWKHDQRSFSETHYACITSVWIAEQSVWLQCLWYVYGLHVLYSCGDFSFSRIFWKQYVNAASFVLQGLSVSYKSEWKSTSKYHLTSKNKHFSLVCIKGQWSFVKASIFISKIPLIPRWKSCPNPLHIFAKLQISLEHSKMMVFRQAWILNFRWNRSPERGHGFSLSGANWLKADLGIVMLL